MWTRRTQGQSRPGNTGVGWWWSSMRRQSGDSCCCRGGGGRAELRMGYAVPSSDQGLRALTRDAGEVTFRGVRLPDAQPTRTGCFDFITRSKINNNICTLIFTRSATSKHKFAFDERIQISSAYYLYSPIKRFGRVNAIPFASVYQHNKILRYQSLFCDLSISTNHLHL